jgi:hypothetical protein
MPRSIDLTDARLVMGGMVVAIAYETITPFLEQHPDMVPFIHIGEPAASLWAMSENQVHFNVLSLDSANRPQNPEQIVEELATFLSGLEPPSTMLVTNGILTEACKVMPVAGLADWRDATYPPTFAVGFGDPLKL